MKKLFLILCLFTFSTLIHSQDKGVSFGFEMTPYLNLPLANKHNLFEHKSGFGAAFTGLIHLKLNTFYALRSGIRLAAFQFEQKDYTLALGCDHDGSGGYLPYNSWIENNYNLYYVGIPLENLFILSEGINHFYFKMGGTIMINIGQSSEVKWFECGIDTGIDSFEFVSEANTFIITTGAGIGYVFSLRKNQSVFIEPNVSYSLTPLLDELHAFSPGLGPVPELKLLSPGISFGISF